MTTAAQIEHRLRHVPAFLGCYAVDELNAIPVVPGSSCILNYGTRHSGGLHWVACLRLGTAEPLYYDPVGGFGPDEDDRVLGVPPTHFKQFLEEHSMTGRYRHSLIGGESPTSDICGEMSTLAVLKNDIPTQRNGAITPSWREIIQRSSRYGPAQFDRYIINLVRLRK